MRSAILAAMVMVAACDDGPACPLSGNSCQPPDGPDIDAYVDPRDAFVCLTTDEPNETIATATPIAMASATRPHLAICSNIDKDIYRITTTQLANIIAITSVADGPLVPLSILNAGGSTLATGTPSGATGLRATVENAPAGEYYVQMTSPVVQFYTLVTNVTAL